MKLESAEEAGGNRAAEIFINSHKNYGDLLPEASGKNSEPPVILGDGWSCLDGSSITLTSSHGKGELDDDKDDGEDQDSTRPGLTPELLENGESQVCQNHGVESSEDDGGEEDGVFYRIKKVQISLSQAYHRCRG